MAFCVRLLDLVFHCCISLSLYSLYFISPITNIWYTASDWPLLTLSVSVRLLKHLRLSQTLLHPISQNGHWTSQAHLPFNSIRVSWIIKVGQSKQSWFTLAQHSFLTLNTCLNAQKIWPALGWWWRIKLMDFEICRFKLEKESKRCWVKSCACIRYMHFPNHLFLVLNPCFSPRMMVTFLTVYVIQHKSFKSLMIAPPEINVKTISKCAYMWTLNCIQIDQWC